MDTEKRATTEDILGDFGYRIVWSVDDVWADLIVYAIVAREGDTNAPLFNKQGLTCSPDCVEKVEDAEPWMTGYVKWDGCSNLDFHEAHVCGADDYIKRIKLMRHIYHRAFELMGCAMPDKWDERV